jgi:TPR repeat protein
LLKSLQVPGLTITAVMEKASASVEYLSQGAQRPWFAAGGGEAANLVMRPAPGARQPVADPMTLDLRLAREAFDCGLPVCLESTAAGVRSAVLRQELLASAAAYRAAARAGAVVQAQPLPTAPPLPSTQPPAAIGFIRAHMGTSDGWVEIADRLMSGDDGFHRDEVAALLWYRAAALAGSGRAAFDVGSAYHRGVGGIPADPAQALFWFRRSADAGYPQAYSMLGVYDGPRAALWFRRGRDLGDAASTRRLADLTFSGTAGLQKDPAAAQRLYLEAAGLGDAESMFRVSSFIFMSRTRPDPVLVGDDATAMGWLLKSAELGYLPSYLQLALDYHLGQNTRQDDVQALQWLLRAAERGSKEAMVTIGAGYATSVYGLSRDCHQAGRWLRRAQVAGSRDALLELFSAAPKCDSYS